MDFGTDSSDSSEDEAFLEELKEVPIDQMEADLEAIVKDVDDRRVKAEKHEKEAQEGYTTANRLAKRRNLLKKATEKKKREMKLQQEREARGKGLESLSLELFQLVMIDYVIGLFAPNVVQCPARIRNPIMPLLLVCTGWYEKLIPRLRQLKSRAVNRAIDHAFKIIELYPECNGMVSGSAAMWLKAGQPVTWYPNDVDLYFMGFACMKYMVLDYTIKGGFARLMVPNSLFRSSHRKLYMTKEWDGTTGTGAVRFAFARGLEAEDLPRVPSDPLAIFKDGHGHLYNIAVNGMLVLPNEMHSMDDIWGEYDVTCTMLGYTSRTDAVTYGKNYTEHEDTVFTVCKCGLEEMDSDAKTKYLEQFHVRTIDRQIKYTNRGCKLSVRNCPGCKGTRALYRMMNLMNDYM